MSTIEDFLRFDVRSDGIIDLVMTRSFSQPTTRMNLSGLRALRRLVNTAIVAAEFMERRRAEPVTASKPSL